MKATGKGRVLKETESVNLMKIKILIAAAMLGAASMSAHAGVRFGFSVGLPLPVVVAPPIVAVAPPVVVASRVAYGPSVDVELPGRLCL